MRKLILLAGLVFLLAAGCRKEEPPPPPPDFPILVGKTEAEDLELTNYRPVKDGDFSNGWAVEVCGAQGHVRGVFVGPKDVYVVFVTVEDDEETVSEHGIAVNGKLIARQQFDYRKKDRLVRFGETTRLATGDTLVFTGRIIEGKDDGCENGEIDVIEVIAAKEF